VSGSEQEDRGAAAPDDDAEFELPLPDEEAGERRLRRRLFGLRSRQVEEEIAARGADVAELRRDVAALWLAFGQHERTIRQLLEAVERIARVEIDPPGAPASAPAAGEREPEPAPAPRPEAEDALGPLAASIGGQLGDLDEVLAAIERATQSLERTYASEIAAASEQRSGAIHGDEGASEKVAEEEQPADGESEERSS
jgi:hypothetical protein